MGRGSLPLVGGSRNLSTVPSCQGLPLSIESLPICHAPHDMAAPPCPLKFSYPALFPPSNPNMEAGRGRDHASPQCTGCQNWIEPGDSLEQSPHFIDGKTGPERRRDMTTVVQKVGGRAEPGPLRENVTAPPYSFLHMVCCPSRWLHLLFNKYLLSTCYVPGSVLLPEITAVNKTHKTPTLMELPF